MGPGQTPRVGFQTRRPEGRGGLHAYKWCLAWIHQLQCGKFFIPCPECKIANFFQIQIDLVEDNHHIWDFQRYFEISNFIGQYWSLGQWDCLSHNLFGNFRSTCWGRGPGLRFTCWDPSKTRLLCVKWNKGINLIYLFQDLAAVVGGLRAEVARLTDIIVGTSDFGKSELVFLNFWVKNKQNNFCHASVLDISGHTDYRSPSLFLLRIFYLINR